MSQPDKEVPWDSVAAIRSASFRKEVLVSLAEKPGYAAELGDEFNRGRQQVSNKIHELKNEGLVECLTPNRPHHRIYGITETGEQVLNHL